ncbi:hypothetical protein PGRAN_12309 [Listeria grandensis FSL F6-0971]|uniref:Uncharacterized protein n=1 Tax=Listeria grandensis FSL F6-0971 TaxID=1265819 RepID=W7BHA2_9LIST|nr:DUF6270 domain-containing protein [Listeria grandensis]EUJ22626.1 hypothetical protein PGRAN_12309 [Listeria grandensis FSL F6-0971]
MTQVKKIAVFGSCFSRNFLSSAPYFNPTYKSHFACVMTQFHSSIIATMTDVVTMDISEYEDIPKEKKRFVREDFEKRFFERIAETNPDYLLIDLYSDALKNIGFISEKQAITISPILEQSRILNDIRFVKMVDHQNKQHFKSVWLTSLHQYRKQLLCYIREEQIILNVCELTSFYYDAQKKKVPYNTPETLDEYNQFWNELNTLFMQVFPKAKVLDMRNSGYIGDTSYPFGHSVSHYESGYYRSMLHKIRELTK